MSRGSHTAERVEPLLLELARAYRAGRFYAPEHPARKDALARVASVWVSGLDGFETLNLKVAEGRFRLDEQLLEGDAIDEVAGALRDAGVRGLEVRADVRTREVEQLVRMLCSRTRPETSELEPALRESGVERIRLEVTPPEARDPSAAEAREPRRPEGSPAEPPSPALADEISAVEASVLGEEYEPALQTLVKAAARSLRRGHPGHAYDAVVALARLSSESTERPRLASDAARRSLRELMRDDELLDFVLEATDCDSVPGKIRAAEVLVAAGATVVPLLLVRHASGEAELRSRISSLLIAMGDAAFPVLVDELTSGEAGRVRRAARLLGDMQHPRGVEFLVRHLGDPNPFVKKEVAMALAQIGTDAAIEPLLAALRGDAETAPIAAACLGNTRSPNVLQALIAIVDGHHGASFDLQREAIRSLGRIGRSEASPALSRVLKRRRWMHRGPNRLLRVAAAHALGRIGGSEAFGLLDAQARTGDSEVRDAANEALRMLLGTRQAS